MSAAPTFIGRYRVEQVLGRGAMGVIYRAHDPDIGRTVAIKLIRADLLDGEDRAEFLTRFRHEAQAAGRCAHPNIVAIHDFATHEGNPFLAMEFVDGVGLGQALKGVGKFAPAEAVAIAVQVLDALAAAHAHGVVHRDIKPANILLLANGQVKVTDFGISRINSSDITQDGTVIGTPAYMSPEQCRGDNVDARSDLFSVGTVLYELLSGARAFGGRSATEVSIRLISSDPPNLASIEPGVGESLTGVLHKAMAKNRDERFASAREMADALTAALRRDGLPAADDRTVVLPPAAFAPAAPAIDDATLDTIERRLIRYIGPIARHLVRDAARRASSIEALCETVSRGIAQPTERSRFLAETLDGSLRRATASARAATAGGASASGASGTGSGAAGASGTGSGVAGASASGISAEQIERAEKALTRVLGPIAKVLVRRTLPGTSSEAMLWERLAARLERPADRDAFLKLRPGG